MRLLVGFVVGAVLGAMLSFAYSPLTFVPDASGWRVGLALLGFLLSHAAAFAIGLLAARIAGRGKILVAAISMWVGAAAVTGVNAGDNLPFNLYTGYYAGYYPFFALLGGVASYAR